MLCNLELVLSDVEPRFTLHGTIGCFSARSNYLAFAMGLFLFRAPPGGSLALWRPNFSGHSALTITVQPSPWAPTSLSSGPNELVSRGFRSTNLPKQHRVGFTDTVWGLAPLKSWTTLDTPKALALKLCSLFETGNLERIACAEVPRTPRPSVSFGGAVSKSQVSGQMLVLTLVHRGQCCPGPGTLCCWPEIKNSSSESKKPPLLPLDFLGLL